MIELGISIIELWISMTLLWMSIYLLWHFGDPLLGITNMDSHNRIMVIQNSIMDIND